MTTTEDTEQDAKELAVREQRAEVQRQQQTEMQRGIALGRGRNAQYSLAELMECARVMAMAGLVPDALKGKPADVLIIVMKGADLGLSPSQSVDAIHAVKGKAVISGHLAVALVRGAGHKVRIADADDSCTVTIIRHDDPEPVTVKFSVADAKRAQIKNEKYQTDPAPMLFARAATRCARRACPEVLLGIYIEGEVDEVEPPRPTLAQVAAERTDREQPAAIEPAAPSGAEQDPDELRAAYEQMDADAAATTADDLFAVDGA